MRGQRREAYSEKIGRVNGHKDVQGHGQMEKNLTEMNSQRAAVEHVPLPQSTLDL